MPNFTKTKDELKTHADRRLYVFKNLATFESQPLYIQEEILQKVFKISKLATLDRQELIVYERDMKIERDLKNTLDYAETTAHDR